VTDLLDEAQRVPGVQSATLAKVGPATGSATRSSVVIEGYTPTATEDVVIDEEVVGAAYTSTIGMRLIAGRDFLPSDDTRGRKVALINETMAKRFFDKKNPVGLGFGYDLVSEVQVIGVIADARSNGLRRAGAQIPDCERRRVRAADSRDWRRRRATRAPPCP